MTLPRPPLPAPDWALFLDFDGTLTPLRQHPDDVLVDEVVRFALRAVARRVDSAVCVTSGRPLQSLRRLLGSVDGVTLIGCHGGEGLDAESAPRGDTARIAAARARLAPVAARFDGVWIEDKPIGFAVHYRRFPHAGAALLDAARDAVAGQPELRVVGGNMVVEILPSTVSKGVVLERLLATPAFRGRVPVAFGDDVTDEDAFAAANRLGGFGVCVGGRTPSCARYRLDDAADMRDWLRAAAQDGPPATPERAKNLPPPEMPSL